MTPRRFGLAAALAFLAGLIFAPACRAQAPIPTAGPGTAPPRAAVLYVVQMLPPPQYETWYHDMERCTGMLGDYRRVEWYLTPLPWSDGLHGDRLTYGSWRPPHKIILNAPERLDSALVSHEALHDILAYHPEFPDTAVHPAAIYGPGKCAEVFPT